MNKLLSVMLVILMLASSSEAQTQEATTTQTSATEHSRQAIAAFKEGKYELAARHFLDAHALAADPVLLYNAAYALGKAGDLRQASDVARRAAQAGLSGGKTVTRNEARLAGWAVVLDAGRHAQAIASTSNSASNSTSNANPTLAKASPPASASSNTLTWIGAGTTMVGAGLLTAAFVVDWSVASKADELEAAKERRDLQSYEQTLSDIEGQQQLGRVLVYSGAAVTLAGLTALVVSYVGDDEAEQVAVLPTVALNPEGVGVGFAGSF